MSDGIHLADAQLPSGLRLYAIGDVHGRADLLKQMHARIMEEIGRDRPADWRIVHLGDYIDRGAQSRQVIDLLANLAADPRIVALRGNHDQGFIDFLADPRDAYLFTRFGGVQTAESYGVTADFGSAEGRERAHSALTEAVPTEHRDFLGALPHSVAFGDFFFCHAGIRPGVALERQSPEDLIWIRSEFLDWQQLHPKVIVHGHTPSRDAELLANRVNVDTMAYASGRLTAFAVEEKRKWLIEATA